MFVVGVDGCREGWIAVALQDGAFAGAGQFASFAEIARACQGAGVIGVDMPIGLVETGERACDRMVRELLGPRRTSVFVTPPRAALMQRTYDEACEECRRRTGFGLSRQAWSLRDKIFEVEAVVRAEGNSVPPERASEPPADAQHRGRFVRHGRNASDSAALRRFALIIAPKKAAARTSSYPGGRVIEVHPEASFRELAGEPLDASKKSYNGLMKRMRLLERAGIHIPHQLEIGKVSLDDVLDAAVVAWTAHRYATRAARSVPPPEQWQYDGKRAIAIWI